MAIKKAAKVQMSRNNTKKLQQKTSSQPFFFPTHNFIKANMNERKLLMCNQGGLEIIFNDRSALKSRRLKQNDSSSMKKKQSTPKKTDSANELLICFSSFCPPDNESATGESISFPAAVISALELP